MSTNWNNANLKIRSSFMPKKLFLAATIDVWLDEQIILSTGGKLKLQGACVEQFDYSGAPHQVKLEWEKFLLHSVPCSLYIDNQLVMKEIVKIENRGLNIISLILLYGIALALVLYNLLQAW